MNILSFTAYNIAGSLIWIFLLLGIGYGAGNLLEVAVDSF